LAERIWPYWGVSKKNIFDQDYLKNLGLILAVLN
jgi:hypothetical protein